MKKPLLTLVLRNNLGSANSCRLLDPRPFRRGEGVRRTGEGKNPAHPEFKVEHHTNRFSQAYTLVEILMAMAIFAMVLTAIYATWTAILRGSRVGAEAAARVQRERIAIQTIEQALTCARSFTLDLQHYGFVGENGNDATLSFVARLPKSFPRSGRFGDFDVRRVAFSVESHDSESQLVLRQCPMLMDFDEDEVNHPLVLARGVKEMLLEFWDTRAGEWADTWTQTNQLPKMVRVSLKIAPVNLKNYTQSQVEEVVRVISIPSVAVPAGWQRPNANAPRPPGT